MPISSCLLLCALATRLVRTAVGHFRRVRYRSQPISTPVLDSLLRKHLPRPSGTMVRVHFRVVRIIQFAAQTEAFALVVGAFLVLVQTRIGARTRIAIRRPQ